MALPDASTAWQMWVIAPILIAGLINRFRDNAPTLKKRSERYEVDSMRVLQGGDSFDG